MLRRVSLLLCSLVLPLLAAGASAAERVALVFGNGAYQHATVLPNAANDGHAIAEALRELDFQVIEGIDLDIDGMRRVLGEFAQALEGAEVGLFYYAGHALEVDGVNYIVPTDARLALEADLAFETLPVDVVLKQIAQHTRVRLIFLDSCRDNPLARVFAQSLGTRSAAVGRGLAQMGATNGTFIAYATAPGEVATDGEGEHSPFTEAILAHIATPGLEVRAMMDLVRASVQEATDGKQLPWDSASFIGQGFYFVPASASVGDDRQADILFWQAIQNSSDWHDFEAYIERFGSDGVYYALAVLRRDKLKVFRDCADCPEMVVIPAGRFLMGGYRSYGENQPLHEVAVEAFAAGRYEVTFAEWDACVAAGGCSNRPDDAGWGRGNHPVINVSWNDAQEYVAWLSRRTGKTYRLLSEAEWEYAARGGTTTNYWWGNFATTATAAPPDIAFHRLMLAWWGGSAATKANYCDTGLRSQPAGSYPANPFGLYEVLGNAWEWTQDCWNNSYDGAPTDGAAWTSGLCDMRVIRGGSWNSCPWGLRAADRSDYHVTNNWNDLGFRLARTLP